VIRAAIVIALIVAGIIIGPLWAGQSGYVQLVFAGYQIETSVVLLLVALILLWALLGTVETLLKSVIRSHRRGFYWLSKRRLRKAEQQFQQALESWLSHDWLRAEQLAKQSAQGLAKPAFGYLLAAMAAEQRDDHQARGCGSG